LHCLQVSIYKISHCLVKCFPRIEIKRKNDFLKSLLTISQYFILNYEKIYIKRIKKFYCLLVFCQISFRINYSCNSSWHSGFKNEICKKKFFYEVVNEFRTSIIKHKPKTEPNRTVRSFNKDHLTTIWLMKVMMMIVMVNHQSP